MALNPKYISIGNRRDKNLSDTEDRTEALNNLLDGLPGDGTFISEDLDVIRGLQYEKVTIGNLINLANTTVKITNVENPIIPVAAEPIVTIRDRVEKAKTVTSDVPPYIGGLGLNARFFKSTEIRAGNVNSTGDNIFIFNNNQPVEPEYWEYGYFTHGSQIDGSFPDQYGGIQWTGYFSPNLFDPSPVLTYTTTGLLMIEYDPQENNNWIKTVNQYNQVREVTLVNPVNNSTTLDITPGQGIRVSIGDRLVSNTNIQIESVAASQITLTAPVTLAAGPITFTRIIGSDIASGVFSLPPVEPGNYVRLRINYWYPNNGEPVEDKNLLFTYISGIYLPFQYMYSKKPDLPKEDEFRTFLNKALSPYNNNFGEVGTLGSNYKELNIGKTYINEYSPPRLQSDVVTAGPININVTNGSTIITTSQSFANTNVGDYLIPTAIVDNVLPQIIQIKNKMNDNNVILTKTPNVTGTYSFSFIDHKGFISWTYATSTGANVTVASTTGLQTNNIMISPGTFANHNRITSIINSTAFSVSSAPGLTTSQPIYIYSEKGITDNSKLVFCAGVFGQVVSTNAPIGNTLVVSSNSGIIAGQVIQNEGYITPGTTVTAVTGTTLSLSGVNSITKAILAGATVTFAPAGTTLNKEICVIPLNTAPPFAGTNDGLSTAGRGIRADATLTQDFAVETSNLVISTNTVNIATVSGVPTFNRKVRINNNQYFLVANTI